MKDEWRATDEKGVEVWSGTYDAVDRTGRWQMRDGEGLISGGRYEADSRTDGWIECPLFRGREMCAFGRYVDGKRTGEWDIRDPDKPLHTITHFTAGTRSGKQIEFCNGGSASSGPTSAAKPQGDLVLLKDNVVRWKQSDGPPSEAQLAAVPTCYDKLPL